MRQHVTQFYEQVRGLLTAQVTVHLGNDTRVIKVDEGSLLSGAVIAAGLPLGTALRRPRHLWQVQDDRRRRPESPGRA